MISFPLFYILTPQLARQCFRNQEYGDSRTRNGDRPCNDHFKFDIKYMKRRQFLQYSTAMGLLPVVPAALPDFSINSPQDRDRTIILFQGDSITDAGRNKDSQIPDRASGLGHGYAFLAAAQLHEEYPNLHPQVYNRGISGNKVFQLADRWDVDALELEPDVISILIGVNDHWHTLRDYPGTAETYATDYDALLARTTQALPDTALIVCEPFVLLEGTAIERDKWVPVFDDYRQASRDLAKKYDAEFVPFQSIFDKALKRAPTAYWAPDGVHPSLAGAQLMANHWMKAFKKIKL